VARQQTRGGNEQLTNPFVAMVIVVVVVAVAIIIIITMIVLLVLVLPLLFRALMMERETQIKECAESHL